MKAARFGVRLFTAWWLVEFVTGFSTESHAISARKHAKQRQARAGRHHSASATDTADLAPAPQWIAPVSPTMPHAAHSAAPSSAALDRHFAHSNAI